MGNLSGIMQQLKRERDRAERELSGLNAAIQAFVGAYGSGKTKPKPTTKTKTEPTRQRRKMSISARKKIAAAQRARWAKWKAQKKKPA
jgi:hypothetical protein